MELVRTSTRLTVGEAYSRAQLASFFEIPSEGSIKTGVFRPDKTRFRSIWLFVTEEKTDGMTPFEDKLDANMLRWQGQTEQATDPWIINHEALNLEILVFYRKHKRQFPNGGFIYEGLFQYKSHEPGSKPTRFILQRGLTNDDLEFPTSTSVAARPLKQLIMTDASAEQLYLLLSVVRLVGKHKGARLHFLPSCLIGAYFGTEILSLEQSGKCANVRSLFALVEAIRTDVFGSIGFTAESCKNELENYFRRHGSNNPIIDISNDVINILMRFERTIQSDNTRGREQFFQAGLLPFMLTPCKSFLQVHPEWITYIQDNNDVLERILRSRLSFLLKTHDGAEVTTLPSEPSINEADQIVSVSDNSSDGVKLELPSGIESETAALSELTGDGIAEVGSPCPVEETSVDLTETQSTLHHMPLTERLESAECLPYTAGEPQPNTTPKLYTAAISLPEPQSEEVQIELLKKALGQTQDLSIHTMLLATVLCIRRQEKFSTVLPTTAVASEFFSIVHSIYHLGFRRHFSAEVQAATDSLRIITDKRVSNRGFTFSIISRRLQDNHSRVVFNLVEELQSRISRFDTSRNKRLGLFRADKEWILAIPLFRSHIRISNHWLSYFEQQSTAIAAWLLSEMAAIVGVSNNSRSLQDLFALDAEVCEFVEHLNTRLSKSVRSTMADETNRAIDTSEGQLLDLTQEFPSAVVFTAQEGDEQSIESIDSNDSAPGRGAADVNFAHESAQLEHIPFSGEKSISAGQLPISIQTLSSLLENMTASYKALLLGALVSIICRNHETSEIPLQQIATDMILLAAELVQMNAQLKFSSNEKTLEILATLGADNYGGLWTLEQATEIRLKLNSQPDLYKQFLRLPIPLFVRPFFEDLLSTTGSDELLRAQVIQFSQDKFEQRKPIYSINPQRNAIVLHPEWANFIQSNNAEICGMLFSRLEEWLLKRNAHLSKIRCDTLRPLAHEESAEPNITDTTEKHSNDFASGGNQEAQSEPIDSKKCPRCGVCSEDIEAVFGYRVMNGTTRPQSYCRQCRKEHSAGRRHPDSDDCVVESDICSAPLGPERNSSHDISSQSQDSNGGGATVKQDIRIIEENGDWVVEYFDGSGRLQRWSCRTRRGAEAVADKLKVPKNSGNNSGAHDNGESFSNQSGSARAPADQFGLPSVEVESDAASKPNYPNGRLDYLAKPPLNVGPQSRKSPSDKPRIVAESVGLQSPSGQFRPDLPAPKVTAPQSSATSLPQLKVEHAKQTNYNGAVLANIDTTDQSEQIRIAFDRIRERLERSTERRSICLLELVDADYSWLLQWLANLNPATATYFLKSQPDARCSGTYTNRCAIGTLLLVCCSELNRREGQEGAAWPLFFDQAGAALRPVIESKSFEGSVSYFVKEAFRESFERLNLRNVMATDDHAQFLLSIFLQFGFTRFGIRQLPVWLTNESSWTEPIRQLLRDHSPNYSDDFYNLWQAMRDFLQRRTTVSAFRSQLQNSHWILPEWHDDVVRVLENPEIRFSLPVPQRGRLVASSSSPVLAKFTWDHPSPPAFVIHFSFERLPLSVEETYQVTVANVSYRLVPSQNGLWSLSGTPTVPITEKEVPVEVLDSTGGTVFSESLTLWEDEDVQVYDISTGRRLSEVAMLRTERAYAVFAKSDLTPEPKPSIREAVPSVDRRVYLLEPNWSQSFKLFLDGDVLWAADSEIAISGVPREVRLIKPFIERRQFVAGEPITISIRGETTECRVESLRIQGVSQQIIYKDGYTQTSEPVSLGALMFSGKADVSLKIRCGGKSYLTRHRIPVDIAGCAIFDGVTWEPIAEDAVLNRTDCHRRYFKFADGAFRNHAPSDFAIFEGNTLRQILTNGKSKLDKVCATGAPIEIRRICNKGSDSPSVRVSAGAVETGLLASITDVSASEVRLELNQPLELSADHSIVVWPDDSAPILLSPENLRSISDRSWDFVPCTASTNLAIGLAYAGIHQGAICAPDPRAFLRLIVQRMEPVSVAAMLRWMRWPVLSSESLPAIRHFIANYPGPVLAAWLNDSGLPSGLRHEEEAASTTWSDIVREVFATWSPRSKSLDEITSYLASSYTDNPLETNIAEVATTIARSSPILMAKYLNAYMQYCKLVDRPLNSFAMLCQAETRILGDGTATSTFDTRNRIAKVAFDCAQRLRVHPSWVEKQVPAIERLLRHEELNEESLNNLYSIMSFPIGRQFVAASMVCNYKQLAPRAPLITDKR